MTIIEILEVLQLIQDPVTHRLTGFGEAAQMQAHPSGGINQVRIVERILLAKYLAGSTTPDIRFDLPSGSTDNPALSSAIVGEGPGNRDTWGNVLADGTYGTAAARLSPANRALALCIVAIQDEIKDIGAKADGSRAADNTLLQSKIAEGAINTDEIDQWVTARSSAVIAQARQDIDALGSGVALAALGKGIAQETVSVDTVTTLLSKHLYDNVRSRAAAQLRFNTHNFGGIKNVKGRLKAVSEALRIAGSTDTVVSGLSANASRVYRDLLREEMISINASISAAKAQFQLHNFEQIVDLTARRQAITAAQAAASRLELVYDVAQVYSGLLAEALTDINAAQAQFNSHRFAEISCVLVRRSAIMGAQVAITSSSAAIQVLSAGASQIYHRILSQELVKLEAAIAAGQARFNIHHFASISDFISRRQAIVSAQAAVSSLGLSVDAAQIYNSLLEQEFVKINTAIELGQGCFNAHHFSEIADVTARRKAVMEARTAVSGLGLDPETTQFYTSLLSQELARNDAIIAEQQRARETAEAAAAAEEKRRSMMAQRARQEAGNRIRARGLAFHQARIQEQSAALSAHLKKLIFGRR